MLHTHPRRHILLHAEPDVASPALSSASSLISKICFSIALPIIIVAVVNGSVATKYVYLRIWKRANVVHTNSWKSLGSWWAICTVAGLAGWILAEAVPSFSLLLGLIGALFGSWFLAVSHGHVVCSCRRLTNSCRRVPFSTLVMAQQ